LPSLGRFSYQKTALRFSHKKRALLALGAFQPSKNSIFDPWGVSAMPKQHFFLLGRFNYQKTAFLVPGAFQQSKTAFLAPGACQPRQNCIFAPLRRFNHQKIAWLWPLGRFSHPKTALSPPPRGVSTINSLSLNAYRF